MKKLLFIPAILLLVSVLIINSCKKKSADEATPTPTPTGTTPINYATAVGTPTGTPISATIDSAGGTLISADGRLQVIIPAHALSAATVITIQPVTNFCPGGTGVVYDVTPNGELFNQPVTLKFHYDSADVASADIHVFGIAYQNGDHAWVNNASAVLDSVGGTENITTTHFTPWALFDKMFSYPHEATLHVHESVEFKLHFISILDDLLAPATEASMYAFPENVVWTVNGTNGGNAGNGTLSPWLHTVTTNYTAPATTASMATNPAAVTAIVNYSNWRLLFNSSVKVTDARTYKVDVVMTGTDLVTVGWGNLNYYDTASFQLSITDPNSLAGADISSISNFYGQILAVINIPNGCTSVPSDHGDLLDITSVDTYGAVNSGLILDIHSNYIAPAYFSVNCSGSPFVVNSTPATQEFQMPAVVLNDSVRVLTNEDTPGELITVRITPQ